MSQPSWWLELAGAARFLALNGATTAAAVAIASRCQLPSRAERLLAVAVVFVGLVLATALGLGISGHLRFWPALLLHTAIAVCVCLTTTRAAVVDALRWPPVREIFRGPLQRSAAVLVALAYVHVVLIGLLVAPFPGDALMYHLPLIAAYAHTARVVVPALGRYWNTDVYAYFPGNAYLLYQWWVLPFGNEALINLVQLPYAAATALATFVLARRFGAGRTASAWGALLFLAIPIVINQSCTPLVDVTITFQCIAGLAFLLATPLTAAHVAMAAIAWGAAPGTKLIALVFVPSVAVCLALHLARRPTAPVGGRRLLGTGIALAGGAALLSGYWFARNAVLTGSPLFPASIRGNNPVAWTNVIFYGPILPLLDFTAYPPMYFYNYETGAGPQFIALALPSALALAAWAVRQRRHGLAMLALLPLAHYAFWLVNVSTEWQTLFRYVLPTIPIGLAAASWFIARTARPRLLSSLAAACVVIGVVGAVPHIGSFTNPAAVRDGVGAWRAGRAPLGRFTGMGDLVVQDFRRTWHFLDREPTAQRLAASHVSFSYPLLGADFQREVHFLAAATPEDWLEQIRAAHIDHVVIAQLTDPEPRISVTDDQAVIHLPVRLVTDEYVAITRDLPATAVRGIRLRVEVPAPANARVAIGLNHFAQLTEVPLDLLRTARAVTIDWRGELRSLEVLLGFQARTALRDELDLSVSGIELLLDNGDVVPVAQQPGRWQRVRWPVEHYWMEQHPERFRLAFSDHEYWPRPNPSELRLYAVVDGGTP